MLAGERLAVLAAMPNVDADIAIKIFNATKDVAQAVPDKKVDPLANLPTFHITFTNGRLGGSGMVTPAVDMGMVVEAFDLAGADPTPEMRAAFHINADVTDELEIEVLG